MTCAAPCCTRMNASCRISSRSRGSARANSSVTSRTIASWRRSQPRSLRNAAAGATSSTWRCSSGPPRFIVGRASAIVRPFGNVAGTVAAAPATRTSKWDGVVEVGPGLRLRRRLILDRRRDRFDQDRFLRLTLILDLADDESDFLVDPVVAFVTIGARQCAAVGGIAVQAGAVVEVESWLVVVALFHVDDRHLPWLAGPDVLDFEELGADIFGHIHLSLRLFAALCFAVSICATERDGNESGGALASAAVVKLERRNERGVEQHRRPDRLREVDTVTRAGFAIGADQNREALRFSRRLQQGHAALDHVDEQLLVLAPEDGNRGADVGRIAAAPLGGSAHRGGSPVDNETPRRESTDHCEAVSVPVASPLPTTMRRAI